MTQPQKNAAPSRLRVPASPVPSSSGNREGEQLARREAESETRRDYFHQAYSDIDLHY